jgi:hypothetical protein
MPSAGSGRSGQMLSRPPGKTGLLPDPIRSAERSAATKELPGRRERKTFLARAETVGQRSRARPSLLQPRPMRGWVSRVGMGELEVEARARPRQPRKRRWPENRPHSARPRAPSRASVEALEQSRGLARPERRTSPADNPGRKLAEQTPAACADRPHSARLLVRSRPRAPPLPAGLQRTRSRALQSASDPGMRPRMATHSRSSALLLLARETMPASQPLNDHLYSWYWSTFTFSSTPMASSVRTAMEQ